MKIIFCLHHFLPESVGGTEVYVANLVIQLIQKGIEAVVIIPNHGIDKTEEYMYEGIRVIKYAENSIEDRAMILGKKKPDGLELFGELLMKEQATLVHFHELSPGKGISILHVEKTHELKIPVVVTFHVPYYTCFRGSLLYKGREKCDGKIIIKRCTDCIYHQKKITGVKALLLNNASNVLFNLNINATGLNSSIGTALGFPFVIDKIKQDLSLLSHYAQQIIVIADWYKKILEKNKIPPEKITFIKQALPNEKPNVKALPMISEPLRVVYIGRITPLKGLHLLIDAVLQIPMKNIALDIYGLETKENYVLTYKEKTKGYNNIHWNGRIPSNKVIPELSKYHVLCLPSAFEMSPLVIQEAFAAGIPVLASDVYGNAEQVKEGENGWLFQVNNENDLKEKLEVLIDNPQMINKARESLPFINTFEKVGAHHIEVYDAVISNYNSN